MNDVEQAFFEFRQAPDPQTLLALLRACQRGVFNLCFQTLGHAQDAEDAAQEALMEIAQGASRVRDAGAFRGWMYRVALHTAIDHKNKRARKAALVKERPRMAAPPPDSPQTDVHQSLTTALMSLNDELRCLVIEHYFEKATLEELGRRHGCSPNAIWKRMERAKERLRRTLEGAGLALAIPHVDGVLESIVPVEVVPNLIQEAVISKVTLLSLTGGIIVGTKTVLSAATVVTAVICLSLGTAGGMLIQSRRAGHGQTERPLSSTSNDRSQSPELERRVSDLEKRLALKDQELARSLAQLKAIADAGTSKKGPTATGQPKEPLARRLARFFVSLGGITKLKLEDLPQEEREQVMRDGAELFNFLTEIKAVDPKNPLALFQSGKGRAFLADLVDALCIETQKPMDESQRNRLKSLLESSAQELGSMDGYSPLEISIAKIRLEMALNEKAHSVLSQDQLDALAGFNPLWNVAGGVGFTASSNASSDLKLPSDAGVFVAGLWNDSLKLSDGERQRVAPLSERYGNDYAQLNRALEARLGADALNNYYDGAIPKSNSERKVNAEIEASFLELQLKYQKELVQVLGPDRESAIQSASRTTIKMSQLR